MDEDGTVKGKSAIDKECKTEKSTYEKFEMSAKNLQSSYEKMNSSDMAKASQVIANLLSLLAPMENAA